MKRFLLLALIAVAACLSYFALVHAGHPVHAQNRMNFPLVAQDSGHVALGLALRKLSVSGTFMQVAAHPDDEHNALYALFTHGMGMRSICLQTTRGEGGQNEIGTELFRNMGVLRTSELMSAHRLDGAEQYFTRAIDYGYSFDPQEVIGKWGRQEIVGDFVRMIRTFRPEVMLTMNIQGGGGDRAHEATTILSQEAYQAAGDPNKYPEQLQQGLRPWQPRKLYFTGGFGGGRGGGGAPATGRMTPVNTGEYDKLLGRTYSEIGTDARSNHKCQGMGGLPSLPGVTGGRGFGGAARSYRLVESTIPGQTAKDETSLFDGVDTTVAALAQYAGSNPPAQLTEALAAIAWSAKRAQTAFDLGKDDATAVPVEEGLTAVRGLRRELASLKISDDARYEIDFRLAIKERDFQDAVLAAHGLTFDAVADDGLVIRGEPVHLQILAQNRGASDVAVLGVLITGFDAGKCQPGTAPKDGVYNCAVQAKVPLNAALTTPYFHDDYWKHPANPAINTYEPGVPFGVPFRPTPFQVKLNVKAGNVEVSKQLPVQYRYVKDIYTGDKRMELNVVPTLSVRVTPQLAVLPAPSSATASTPVKREIHVTVTNGMKDPAQAAVTLDVPAGWKVTPASAALQFEHEDESLSARFEITAPPHVKAGAYTLHAVVTSSATGVATFSSGYEEIEYPHVERRQVIEPAEAELKVVDVKIVPNLNVGYIAGAGDQVPPAIEQLGAKLSYIGQDELAWGNLSKYDVIVTGVRAYERRSDLRAYNHRLLDYAERGGTVIVQYNKMEFNQAQYGPYRARVGSGRVSDESVPVKVLVPAHPVFNFPNKIGPETWANWVQERGLYFLGDKDPKYVDLVSMVDSFPDNPGEKLGSFVEGKAGKGRWIYLGLALWRQLPAGTDGAYFLLANLLSLPKAPVHAAQSAH
jgi:LmbE family N-acetylglucosaminyl deacetylase